MTNLAQQFIEMVASAGKARQLGLPPDALVVTHWCPTCGGHGDHVSTEHRDDRGAVWETLACIACGQSQQYCVS